MEVELYVFGDDWREPTYDQWVDMVRRAVHHYGLGSEISYYPMQRDLDDFQHLRRFLVRCQPQNRWNPKSWRKGWRRLTDDERATIATDIGEQVTWMNC
jgi:hypothetical protein